jgi:hypothetical protein
VPSFNIIPLPFAKKKQHAYFRMLITIPSRIVPYARITSIFNVLFKTFQATEIIASMLARQMVHYYRRYTKVHHFFERQLNLEPQRMDHP